MQQVHLGQCLVVLTVAEQMCIVNTADRLRQDIAGISEREGGGAEHFTFTTGRLYCKVSDVKVSGLQKTIYKQSIKIGFVSPSNHIKH